MVHLSSRISREKIDLIFLQNCMFINEVIITNE
jgi:hypothetical protein